MKKLLATLAVLGTAVIEWQRLCVKAERERDGLRKALAAYRSALRSGEPESEQLRKFGDDALKEGQ